MPILLGFFFCYMFVLLLQHQSSLYELDFRWYFCLFYLLMIDITHNFYIFSSWIAFVVFFYFCADWLRINFKVGKLIPALFVCCAYVLVYCIDGLLTYIDNGDLKIFSKEYFYYILLESLLATLFFKDELR